MEVGGNGYAAVGYRLEAKFANNILRPQTSNLIPLKAKCLQPKAKRSSNLKRSGRLIKEK
jgi:hypothetical protein